MTLILKLGKKCFLSKKLLQRPLKNSQTKMKNYIRSETLFSYRTVFKLPLLFLCHSNYLFFLFSTIYLLFCIYIIFQVMNLYVFKTIYLDILSAIYLCNYLSMQLSIYVTFYLCNYLSM